MLMIRPPETGKHSADVIFLILRATSIQEAISMAGLLEIASNTCPDLFPSIRGIKYQSGFNIQRDHQAL